MRRVNAFAKFCSRKEIDVCKESIGICVEIEIDDALPRLAAFAVCVDNVESARIVCMEVVTLLNVTGVCSLA